MSVTPPTYTLTKLRTLYVTYTLREGGNQEYGFLLGLDAHFAGLCPLIHTSSFILGPRCRLGPQTP